jgi:hypothetical protein
MLNALHLASKNRGIVERQRLDLQRDDLILGDLDIFVDIRAGFVGPFAVSRYPQFRCQGREDFAIGLLLLCQFVRGF